ncbi:MAG: hypothetical protein H6657_05480 [Ardenticatenaceae bacterium]|nr:hypothetical protein [Ardenticatenaceae bacterium]
MTDSARTRWFWLAVLLIALVAAWPELSQPGLLNTRGGGDSPFLLQRLQQLETAVLDGHFPVRWMPDANYGYGYPFYNFYAPLSIYITFLFRLLGFSYVRAIHLSHLLGYIVAGLGMFALVRRWVVVLFGRRPGHEWPGYKGEWAGLIAAAAYTVAPFHLVNVYVRGDSLAEFWAMAFYPLVILTADGLVGGGRRQVALFALAYAALILSHNISAMIFSPFLLLYLLLKYLPQRAQRAQSQSLISNLQSPILGLLLAFALSAWFFVPALAEQSLAQLGTVTSGYFHYSNHFLGTAELPLTQATFFVDYGVANREAFRMGLVQTAVLIPGLLALFWLWRQHREMLVPALFILLTVAVSTFMLTPLSDLLWQYLPLLSFTQFPWRFLSVQAFGGALAVGALALALPKPQWWTPPLIALLLVSSLGQLKTDHLRLTDADVTAESLAQYEWFTGNIGTTISFEYLPPTVQPRPYTSSWLNMGERWTVTPLVGALSAAQLEEGRTTYQNWTVETAVPSTLIFPTLHWPGWQARLDGEVVAIRPSAGSGLIELDVPAGTHQIELRLGRTPVRWGAEIASLLAVLLTIWLLQLSRPRWNRQTGLILAGLFVLAVVPRLWPEADAAASLRTWDFVQMGYLHPEPDGVTFSSGAVLHQATLPETAVPGEAILIELAWAVPPTEAVTLALFSPAINWPTVPELQPPAIAQQTLPGAAVTTFELTLPENAPTGLFVPRLTLANGRALTPAGSSRDAIFLSPLRVVGSAGSETAEQLTVRGVGVTQSARDRLTVQLAWFTPQPISQNYNVALRLTDAQGRFLRLVDTQPGYGFLPSSGWPAGQWVNDWLTMPLPPAEENHERPFVLVAQLYEAANPEAVVLTRRLGELVEGDAGWQFQPTEPVFVLPEEMEAATAVFGEEIQLQGYQLSQTNEALDLTLVWQALADGQTDYIRFVHLIDVAEGGAPLAQNDSPPRYGSYPTSQWVSGEVIQDRLSLPLTDVPPGSYQLAVGFYSQPTLGQFNRLPVFVEDGGEMPDGRFVLPVIVTIGP